jgi:tetratricopeptide (TPR) repeat protein
METGIKNCIVVTFMIFCNLVAAQEKKINKEILDGSCQCIRKIDVNLSKASKNDSIKKCITTSIIFDQTKQQMLGIKSTVDSLLAFQKDTTLPGKNMVILVDKDYDEIQKQLMSDCPSLKEMIAIDNDKHKNSMSDKKKALEFYNDAEQYFNNEEYDQALVRYNKAVQADPDFAFAWDNLGICYRKLKRYQQAIECYNKSLALDPKGTVPLMNMAVAYDLMNDKPSAISTYKRFIKIHPEDPEGFYGISRLRNQTGDYANALEDALNAYTLYDKISSPYKEDALNVMREIVSNLKNEGKISIYNTFADKYGLTKIKE